MVIALIIISALLIGSLAFNFILLWVLKNTLTMVDDALDMAQNKTPRSFRTAYDGKYYPATVIAKIQFSSPQEMTITDFSLYETKKIVGFTICTKESLQEYYGDIIEEMEEEDVEMLDRPAIFKNVIVFAPREGMWTWKSVE